MAAERIRVFVAGDIYVKRALVRRFLEDDGFEVVGEARTREDMVAASRREQPDAIVVDDELLADGPGGGTMGRLRRASPDAKIVVFTSTPVDASADVADAADGYLEKGLGLASLTALLGRLFSQPEVAPSEAALAEAASAAPAGLDDGPEGDAAPVVPPPPMDEPRGEPAGVAAAAASSGPSRSGRAPRLVAMVAGVVLIVWGIGAMIATGADDAPVRALDTTDRTDTGTVVDPQDDPTPLDRAHATLDEMLAAIESGNYVLATVDARALMELRDEARDAGFALTGIDAEIVARLDGVVATIPTRVSTQLADILSELYPTTDGTPGQGDPAETVLDPVTDASTDAPTPAGGLDTTTDPRPAPSPREQPRPAPDPSPPPQQEPPRPAPEPTPGPQPGDGREWGRSHNPHGGPPGQTGDHPGPTERQKENHDGGKPPWAGGD